VYIPDETGKSIDALLADARVLADYDAGHAPTAAERIARAMARNQLDMVVCHIAHSDQDERARRQLDLIAARVLNTPQAAASLSRLEITDHVEPEGAVVFACLLYLVGREEGAEFWWKFAAGGGDYIAAQCLALHSERNAGPDAEHWREEAESLFVQQGERAPKPTSAAQHPLLPDHVTKQLLAQCLRGVQPRLPDKVEEAVDDLVDEYRDESLGKIPLPRQPGALGAH
jgi:hypothetical protein